MNTTPNNAIFPVFVPAAPALNQGRKEVAFIDTGVADYQALVDGMKAGVEVVLIQSSQSGLAQMAEWAKTHTGYDAIHILSHGAEGSIHLGADTLNQASLSDAGVRVELANLGRSLKAEGDLLIYGCNVAQGDAGTRFIEMLGQITNADVAASTDTTGASQLNGNWVLETSTGQIETVPTWTDHNTTCFLSTLGANLAPQFGALDTNGAFVAGTLANSITYTENSNPVTLNTSLHVNDTELAVAGNYAGAILTLSRHGGANAEDVFSVVAGGMFDDYFGEGILFQGDALDAYDADLNWLGSIGNVTKNLAGILQITFNTNATPSLVDSLLQQLAYRNTSQIPSSSVQIDWVFSDGNTGTQGTGGSLSAEGSTTVTLEAVNDAPLFIRQTGIVTTAIAAQGLPSTGYGVVLQGDGKIVAVGGGNSDFALARYNADGSLDRSFAGDGTLMTAPGSGIETARSITIQSDGKLLVAGNAWNGTDDDFALVRYNSDGSLDTRFDVDGIAITAIGLGADSGFSVGIQSDGKILVAGVSSNGTYNDFALVRYNSDGSLDSSFDSDGKLTTTFGASVTSKKLVVQTDGKILVAGNRPATASLPGFVLARYNPDGNLDNDFFINGLLDARGVGATGVFCSDIAVQLDGKIVVAGYVVNGGKRDFALLRLDADGAPDTSFNSGTLVKTTDFFSGHDSAQSLTLQTDGKILVAGYCGNTSQDFGLARYNTDGSLDTTFDGDGKVTLDILGDADIAYDVTVQSDGKILVQGTAMDPGQGTNEFALARLNADGSLDTTFGSFVPVTLANAVDYVQINSPAILNPTVRVNDAELAAGGSYAGASVLLARHSGANADDVFSAKVGGTLGVLTAGGNLIVSGTTIGTVTTNGAGTLLLAFNSNATQLLVDSALQQIAYSNTSNAPATSVQIDWTFNDGNTVAQGSGEARSVAGSTTVNIAVNDAPTFAIGDGIVTTSVGPAGAMGFSLTLQSDGKVVVGGATTGASNFALVRYNSDGSLDTSFDGDGKVTTSIGLAYDGIRGLVLQSDNKLIAAGSSYNDSGNYGEFALARYNTDGSVDASFSGDGKLTTSFSGVAYANGVAYGVGAYPIAVAGVTTLGSNKDFALGLYSDNGTVIVKQTAIGTGDDGAESIISQSDGTFFVAGYSYNGTNNDFALVQYDAQGNLFTWFEYDGKATTDFGGRDDYAYALAQQANGQIVVAGLANNGRYSDFALARYNANGSLDTSFDTDGKVTTDFGYGSSIRDVVIQGDGKIVVSGNVANKQHGVTSIALARYNMNGSLDTSFGNAGKVITEIRGGFPINDSGEDLALQADGKILVGGFSVADVNDAYFSLVRYNADGSLDTSFDPQNFLNGTPTYTVGAAPVVLDADVRVSDAELNTIGNYAGATLTLSRHGGANAQDGFSASGTLAALVEGADLTVDNVLIGTVTSNSAGTLLMTFTSLATRALVEHAMQQIAYANTSDAPPASVQIDWTFNDGNTGVQGGGGALSVAGSTTINISAVNHAPTSTFSDGIVLTELGYTSLALSITTQSDRKILVAGYSKVSDSDTLNHFSLVRYNTDGSLDSSFSNDGKIVSDFSGASDIARSIVVQTDGKILLAGTRGTGASADFALVRYNSDGSLDTSFDSDGLVTTDIDANSDSCFDVSLQTDGKIVVVGSSSLPGTPPGARTNGFSVVRYNPDGSLDRTFDSDGKQTTVLGFSVPSARGALQADGKLVVAGGASSSLALARYNTDGSLDTTFDADGQLTSVVAGALSSSVSSVLVQSDNKILVVGTTNINGKSYFLLMRYNTDGSLDTSFDGDGSLLTELGAQQDYARNAILQADGKILVTGYSVDDLTAVTAFALVRYNADGTLDTSFDGDGKVNTLINDPAMAFDVTLQADGKILVTGTAPGSASANSTSQFALIRYNTDGSVDTSFDPINTLQTTVTVIEGGRSRAVLAPEGRIFDADLAANNYEGATLTLARHGGANVDDQLTVDFAGGWVQSSEAGILSIQFDASFNQTMLDSVVQSITYYNTSKAPPASVQIDWTFNDGNTGVQGSGGALSVAGSTTVNISAVNDAPTFATTGGKLITDFADGAGGLTLQADGKIVVTGQANVSYVSTGDIVTAFSDIAVFRYNLDGSLDSSFDIDGKLTTPIGTYAFGAGVVVQPADGKLVVAGASVNSSGRGNIALVRYNTDGSLDTAFDSDGQVLTAAGAFDSEAYRVALVGNKILVAGSIYNSDWSQSDLTLLRYNADGSLDTSFDSDGIQTARFPGFPSSAGWDVFVQTDGKILVSGVAYDAQSMSSFALVRYNQNGSLDLNFSSDGMVTAANGQNGSVVVQADNKILVAGSSDNNGVLAFSVVRYNSDGSLDTGFVAAPLAAVNQSWAQHIALQSDGKILVAGYTWDDQGSSFLLVRYNTNGSLDRTFDGDGIVQANFGNRHNNATDLAVLPDGRIVVGGISVDGPNSFVALARYNPDGSLDLGFGAGKNTLDGSPTFVENGAAVVLDRHVEIHDHELAARGNFSGATLTLSRHGGASAEDQFVAMTGLDPFITGNSLVLWGDLIGSVTSNANGTLALAFNANATEAKVNLTMRMITYANSGEVLPPNVTIDWVFNDGNTDGAQGSGGAGAVTGQTTVAITSINDAPTFSFGDGIVTTSVGSTGAMGFSLALQSDGKVLVGGGTTGSWTDFAVVRYNSDGSLDTTFDGDGKVTTDINNGFDGIRGLVTQPDGKLLAAGASNQSYWGGFSTFSLARYNTDGSPDTTFSGDGKLTETLNSGDDYATSIAYGSGAFPIAAAGCTTINGNKDFVLRLFQNDGTLNSSLTKRTPIGTGDDVAESVIFPSYGRIFLAGYSYNGSNDDFALVQYNALGNLVTSFDTDGKVTTDFSGGYDHAYALTQQADGQIVVAGGASNGRYSDFALARYNANGSLDTSFDADGKVTTDFGFTAYVSDIAIQTDGKIVVCGFVTNKGAGVHSIALARYNTNGSLDTSFGNAGKVITEIRGGFPINDSGEELALQSDGKILVGGYTASGSANDAYFALLRYNTDGSLDTSFDYQSTLNGTPTYTENTAPVVLDADVRVSDADLNAIGNYAGATLTLSRHGGANAQDGFSASGTLAALVEGAGLTVDNVLIGTVTSNSAGTLLMTFTSLATRALVEHAMQQIAYANASVGLTAQVQIDWVFNDGNSATVGGALTVTGSTTVNVVAVTTSNHSPMVTSGDMGTIAENAAISTVVYTAAASDVDSGQTLTFSLSGTDAGSFNINASTGAVTLKASADYETKASYSLDVLATDNGTDTLSASKPVVISVSDVNEAPSLTSGSTGTVAENAAISTVVYTAVASDIDSGQTLTYSLSGTDAGSFNINASTGVITLKATADYETQTSYSLDVIATDNGTDTLSASKPVMISVSDVNENSGGSGGTPAPSDPSPPPVPTTNTVDGTPISTTTITTGGTTTTTQTVAPVTTTRPEDTSTPNATLADIPLAQDNAGTPLVQVGLPVGVGLTSSTATGSTPNLREQLIAASDPLVSNDPVYQEIVQQGIDQYVPTVTDQQQVTVRTLTLTVGTGTTTAPSQPIIINGAQGTGEDSTTNPLRQEALVIDARNLPSGTVINLDNVEFAIIIGAARVTGGDGRNFVVGDDSAQYIVLGADDDVLRGGGGDDTVGSQGGNDQLFGDAGSDTLFGGQGNDQLDGGSGSDQAQFVGQIGEYKIHHSFATQKLIVSDKQTARDDVDTLIGIEQLKFGTAQQSTNSVITSLTPTLSSSQQFTVLQTGDLKYIGKGMDNDVYLISGAMLQAGTEITITDAWGSNRIQLADGLSIKSSLVANTAMKLTLSNNAVVTVLSADKFTYDVGLNLTAEVSNDAIGYLQLINEVLNAKQAAGNGIFSGGATLIGSSVASPVITTFSTANNLLAVHKGMLQYVGKGIGDDTYLLKWSPESRQKSPKFKLFT